MGWKWELDSAEIELIYDANKIDKEKKTSYTDKLKNVNERILDSEVKSDFTKFYLYLKEKEILLREIQQMAGKGTKYKDDWDEGLD